MIHNSGGYKYKDENQNEILSKSIIESILSKVQI